ncbi:MAG: thiamine-phosphate kinase [Pirellulaceae bacterium]|nr:thiamine-phosphate kinase [Pirellulaceae bacterium]
MRWLEETTPTSPAVALGIGDDGAILRGGPEDWVVAADMLLDGVHFDLQECGGRAAGRKALAVNLSDLAAMCATPTAALVTVALPPNAAQLAREIHGGIVDLAAEFELAICGGDTNCWAQSLAISVTAIGKVTAGRAWKRSGGQPGDVLLATGSFGGSLSGKHLTFTPRVREALVIGGAIEVHAAIDVSDGVAIDCSRLAAASECGVALRLDRIPVSAAALELSPSAAGGEEQSARSALDRALSDGEDFELVIAVAPSELERLPDSDEFPSLTQIGVCIDRPGLWSQTAADEELRPLTAAGFLHGESR